MASEQSDDPQQAASSSRPTPPLIPTTTVRAHVAPPSCHGLPRRSRETRLRSRTATITPIVVQMPQPACFFDDYDDGDADDDVTITAVAAAAFAGGWFCALLAMITMACWSELTMEAGANAGEDGRWRAGFGAWLVRVFMDR